jgi:hypothetical protein
MVAVPEKRLWKEGKTTMRKEIRDEINLQGAQKRSSRRAAGPLGKPHAQGAKAHLGATLYQV